MKFMKLGSKQDIFTVHSGSTSVACDLPSDVTFDVDGHKFHLHKFPLLAKWGGLNKLIAESQSEEILIQGFPGGATCFEMCAKYCYGITITLSPHNVGEVRCGAEFLEMTETTEKSNLIYKLEVFLNSSILRGWKDAVICLRSSKAHLPWSEDLKIIGRCIESISSKACVDVNEVDWSFSYSRLQASASGRSSSTASWNRHRMTPAPKDWWVEDLIDLDIDIYTRVILAIKAKGGSPDVVAESIRVYTLKCLAEILQEPEKTPNEDSKSFAETTLKEKQILETIVGLLPLEKGTSSCSFLLRLLKAATFLDASPDIKMELARRVGLQLEEASLHDLIIPSVSYASDTVCDVDLMIHIVEHYMTQFHENQAQMGSSVDFVSDAPPLMTAAAMHNSLCKVAKVIDRYLAEIARDSKMPIPKFIQLASSVPDFARPVHDGLYRAIDMYLKEHPQLTKSERKKICRLMDCKKLSMEACMHAAQNERLPLRVMVQVLFFDQVRTSTNGVLPSDLQRRNSTQQASEYGEEARFSEAIRHDNNPNESSTGGDENWETVHQDFTALKGDLASIKVRIAEAARERSLLMQQDHNHHVKNKGVLSVLKPEKLFSKLFSSRGFSSTSESSRDSVSSELSMSLKQQLRQSSA